MRILVFSLLLLFLSCQDDSAPLVFTYTQKIDSLLEQAKQKCPPQKIPAMDAQQKANYYDLIDTALMQDSGISARAHESLLDTKQQSLSYVIAYAQDPAQDLLNQLAAISLLGDFQNQASGQALLQLLENTDDPQKRMYAAEALGRSRQYWVLPSFLLRLKTEMHPRALIWTIEGLAVLGNFSGVAYLWKDYELRYAPMKYQEATIQQELQEVLRKIYLLGHKNAEQENVNYLEECKQIAAAWWDYTRFLDAKQQDECLHYEILSLVKNLSLWQLRDVDDARFRLQHLGVLSVPSLILGLQDENRYIRFHCIEVLGRLGPRAAQAVRPLLQIAKDPMHRPEALNSLGEIRATEAIPEFLLAIQDPDPNIRIAAIAALKKLQDPASTENIEQALAQWSTDIDFSLLAQQTLVLLGKIEYLCQLAQFINDPQVDQDLFWQTMDECFAKLETQGVNTHGYFQAKDLASKQTILQKYCPQ